MGTADVIERLDDILRRLAAAEWRERDGIKAELAALLGGDPAPSVLEHLRTARKGLKLEVRWEVDEVLEELEPEPEPEAEEEEVEEEPYDPTKPPTMADLTPVYQDPRGMALFKHKRAERFFATQMNPQTGQMQLFELHPTEYEQLKQRLQGSPFWVLGSGQ